jgi:hypothetical protein
MVDDVKIAELAAVVAEKMIQPSKGNRWEMIKKKLVQLLGGLIMEKNEDGLYVISTGKFAWWLAFIPAIVIWVTAGGKLDAGEALKDISPNHFNILLTLAGYNMSKRLTNVAKNFIASKQAKDETDGPG